MSIRQGAMAWRVRKGLNVDVGRDRGRLCLPVMDEYLSKMQVSLCHKQPWALAFPRLGAVILLEACPCRMKSQMDKGEFRALTIQISEAPIKKTIRRLISRCSRNVSLRASSRPPTQLFQPHRTRNEVGENPAPARVRLAAPAKSRRPKAVGLTTQRARALFSSTCGPSKHVSTASEQTAARIRTTTSGNVECRIFHAVS